eukprot:124643_1
MASTRNSTVFHIMICCLLFLASVSCIASLPNHYLQGTSGTSPSTHSISARHLLADDGRGYVFDDAGKFKVIQWLRFSGFLPDFVDDILSDNGRMVLAYALKLLRQKTGQDTYTTIYNRQDMSGAQIDAFQRRLRDIERHIKSCQQSFSNYQCWWRINFVEADHDQMLPADEERHVGADKEIEYAINKAQMENRCKVAEFSDTESGFYPVRIRVQTPQGIETLFTNQDTKVEQLKCRFLLQNDRSVQVRKIFERKQSVEDILNAIVVKHREPSATLPNHAGFTKDNVYLIGYS